MQDNNANTKKPKSRKAWYQKAMQVAKLWRVALKPPPTAMAPAPEKCSHASLRKCSSTSSSGKRSGGAAAAYCYAATPPRTPPRAHSYPSSLTRSCLCAPLAYTADPFSSGGGGDGNYIFLPPRRSCTVASPAREEAAVAAGLAKARLSIGGGTSAQPVAAAAAEFVKARLSNGAPAIPQPVAVAAGIPKARLSNGSAAVAQPVAAAAFGGGCGGARRRVFRGKSVMDNTLMRRAVMEEEAMMMMKRRNEFAIMQRRNSLKRRQIGPSPLSRVAYSDGNDNYNNNEECG